MEEIECTNSLFEQPWWLDIVAPGEWEAAEVKDSSGKIIARMPYLRRKGRFGKSRIMMPDNTQNLGPWFAGDIRTDTPGNKQFVKQKEIVDELLSQMEPFKECELTLNCANTYVLPWYWHGFKLSPTFSYRIDASQSSDDIFANFSKSTRKNIRKAQQESTISYETDIDTFYYILDKTYEAQDRKNPDSREFITKMIETCDKQGHGKMFTARDKDGNLQCSSYLVYDKKIAYALVSGSVPAFRGSGSKSLVYWEEIQHAIKVSKVFDFEGSMIEGIENVMRQFGAHWVTNYHISKSGSMRDIYTVMKPRIKRMIGYKM